MLIIESLDYNIQKRPLLKGLTFSARKGELLAIVGANGAGKSTLLDLLSGEKKPSSGKITLDGKDLSTYHPEELALKRATLSQHNAVNMAFTVEEIVMMGRYPHFRGSPKEKDFTVVKEVMEITGINKMAERSVLQLSGGEQQRVQLARILAQLWDQKGGFLLLDEPIAGLDMLYQQQTLAIAKAIARQGFIVVAVLHELNLAAQYADRILMMKNGRRWKDGTPAEVFNALDIYSVFGIEAEIIMNPKTLVPYIITKEIKLNLSQYNSSILVQKENISLKAKYEEYKTQNPHKKIREIGEELAVSEMELLMTGIGDNVTLLKPKIEEILMMVESLGKLMALTRNDYCVHERKGTYLNYSKHQETILFVGEDIDLRIFPEHWKHVFSVTEDGRKSIQFFDEYGVAIHKIYLTTESNIDVFENLTDLFSDEKQEVIEISKNLSCKSKKGNSEDIDELLLKKSWLSMQDTHEFTGFLKQFNITRLEALKLAPEGLAEEISFNAFREVMVNCTKQQIPIMLFVSNKGCIQIHSGVVKNLVDAGNWYNVLDTNFNLHLKENGVANVWKVIKPTRDGEIHAIELLDKQGELIVQIFGKRKPGMQELYEWKAALSTFSMV